MDATPQEEVEGMAIVKVLACVLDTLVVSNNTIAQGDPGQVTKFHAMKAPGIGVLQYLERIRKYASCSNECYVLALIYIDRLIQKNNFLLTELNVHRVVITAILLAAKFFDDAYYNNAYYAKIGGVLVSEINGLEVDFLFRINFSLHVTPEEYEKYRAELWSQSSKAQTIPVLPNAVQQPLSSPLGASPCRPVVASHHYRPHSTQAVHPSHITPSPPPEACRVEDSRIPYPIQGSMSAECYDGTEFRPMQRANSAPYPSSGRFLPGSSFEMYMNQFTQTGAPTAQRLM